MGARLGPKCHDANIREWLDYSELDTVSGGIGIQREPTYHPAKVTVPDLKLSRKFAETPLGDWMVPAGYD